uniref:Uncharacterized protein LOC101493050 n=1 Tax=Cicer arietinum TaxID=3827 RepID=A0A1S2XJS3_CICAR|nr:uncharacterized protein LOC101493050 [Cicer arietinum]
MLPRRNNATRVNVNRDDQMAETMNNMVAYVALQTAAKTLRDLEKREKEICAAESRGLEDFCHHNPLKFRGAESLEKTDHWIQEVENIFEMINYQAMVKVNYATYLLLGDAEYWWRCTRLLMGSAHEEVNLESFKRKFLDKYFPMSTRTKLGYDFLKLYQGNMIVDEYVAKFQSLSIHFRFFREEVDEQFMCHRFQNGLKYEIQDSVLPLGIQRFQNKKGKQVVKPYNRPHYNNRGQNRLVNQNIGRQLGQLTRCFQYGEEGNYANACTSKSFPCYNCQKLGHFARDCKALKVEPIVNATRATRPTAKGRIYCMSAKAGNQSSNLIQRDYSMDWMSYHYVILDCACKLVLFPEPGVVKYMAANKLGVSLREGTRVSFIR